MNSPGERRWPWYNQIIDAIKTKIADVLAQMAVGDDVPGIEEVDKSIRIGLTCALGWGCRCSRSVATDRDP